MSAIEITVGMRINVDGSPNAYGPDDDQALDFELNAHVGAKKEKSIVGYLTAADKRTPIVQDKSLGDPCPGFFISTTAYFDKNNARESDPRRYVNAAEINYTLWAKKARDGGVKLGDFCVVHSKRTRRTVYAIVGDSGNDSGAEGSLALLQRLGYPFNNGKSGEAKEEIVVRYFPGSNPNRLFFFNQSDLENAARGLDLDTDFSAEHSNGDPGILVLDAVGVTTPSVEAPRVEPFAPLKGEPMVYPGRILKVNSGDLIPVGLVQKRLRDLGYTEAVAPGGGVKPLTVDGVFDNATFEAVQLFQLRHTDLDGDPLEVDGEVGSETWGALFGRKTVHASPPSTSDSLLGAVLDFAADEIGVLEQPPGSNKGPRVEQYQKSVGIDRGDFWCVAFVYFCFEQAAKKLGVVNPMKPKFRTGGVLELWVRARGAGIPTLTHDDALDDPSKVEPGMIFILATGGGFGHAGLVESAQGGKLVTIEGNTNDSGSRNGIGVYRRSGRSISSINRGFVFFKST
ncbi:MAG: peptidoglycan-binding protein [Terrimicrobiaceae bacterium]